MLSHLSVIFIGKWKSRVGYSSALEAGFGASLMLSEEMPA